MSDVAEALLHTPLQRAGNCGPETAETVVVVVLDHHDYDHSNSNLLEKPPPVPPPSKRKKKLDTSLVDLSCNAQMDGKRQRLEDSAGVCEVRAKPPIAPKPPVKGQNHASDRSKEIRSHCEFRLKRKNEESNAALVQKLNSYAEQLRLEVADLKAALVTEKSAVRALK